ncbi:MAG: DUF4390 domain-containing protein [Gammaproteobacteria bacterium]
MARVAIVILRRCLPLLRLPALLLCAPFAAAAAGDDGGDFAVRDVWLQKTPEGYAVQADLAVADSQKLRAILKSGITLRMHLEMRFLRERNWWLDEDLGFVTWEPSLSFDSLLSRYVVVSGGRKTGYDSLSAALGRLGRLRARSSDNPGFARMRELKGVYIIAQFEADIGNLSAPMQVDLLTDDGWDTSSGWRRFVLQVRD